MTIIFEYFLGFVLGSIVLGIFFGTNLFKDKPSTRTSKVEADILDDLFTQVDKKCNDLKAIEDYNRKRNELRKKAFPDLPPINFDSEKKDETRELGPAKNKSTASIRVHYEAAVPKKHEAEMYEHGPIGINIYEDFVPKKQIHVDRKNKSKRTNYGGPL